MEGKETLETFCQQQQDGEAEKSFFNFDIDDDETLGREHEQF